MDGGANEEGGACLLLAGQKIKCQRELNSQQLSTHDTLCYATSLYISACLRLQYSSDFYCVIIYPLTRDSLSFFSSSPCLMIDYLVSLLTCINKHHRL